MIAQNFATLRAARVPSKAWLIEPFSANAWDGNTYYRAKDGFVSLCGYATVELVKDLCARIAYELGRDERGLFRGSVLVNPGDERFEPFFGELSVNGGRRTPSGTHGWEILKPDDLSDLRIATALSLRPIITVTSTEGPVEIAPTMSTFGLYVASDTSMISAAIKSVISSYPFQIDWNSRDILDSVDVDHPLESFDP